MDWSRMFFIDSDDGFPTRQQIVTDFQSLTRVFSKIFE